MDAGRRDFRRPGPRGGRRGAGQGHRPRDRDQGRGGAPGSPFDWPDWGGRVVVVAASGPSLVAQDLAAARGRAVVCVINETWRAAPWANCLYACDARWWRLRGPGPSDFGGLRVIGADAHPGCVEGGVARGVNVMQWAGRRLGAGANSGFQAVNLAARCGARRVVLTGFDLSLDHGVHWHGPHVTAGLSNPDARMLAGCARLLDAAAEDLTARGVEVINASRRSALTRFPKMHMREALA